MRVSECIESSLMFHNEQIAIIIERLKIVKELELDKLEANAHLWTEGAITIYGLDATAPGLTLFLTLVQIPTAPTLQSVARMVMEKTRQPLKKRIIESDGQYQLETEYKGVKIVLQGNPPPRCKIEAVTEEVLIPAVAEHYEKRTHYVATGDCDPLFSSDAEPISVEV